MLTIGLMTGCGDSRKYHLFQVEDKEKLEKEVPHHVYQKEVAYENVIAPNDRVAITVYVQSSNDSQQMSSILSTRNVNSQNADEEDIGLLVSQDGTLQLPLIGKVKVSGYTEAELADMLITKYKTYIRNPYATVQLKNQRVIVLGEVSSPGVVQVTNGTMNLIEAIALSGDLTTNALRNEVFIIRGDLRKPEVRTVDLTSLDAIASNSLLLRPKDIVYVQPREIDGFNKAVTEITPVFGTMSTIMGTILQRNQLVREGIE
jgi:polysaccharide export outer membrane protein